MQVVLLALRLPAFGMLLGFLIVSLSHTFATGEVKLTQRWQLPIEGRLRDEAIIDEKNTRVLYTTVDDNTIRVYSPQEDQLQTVHSEESENNNIRWTYTAITTNRGSKYFAAARIRWLSDATFRPTGWRPTGSVVEVYKKDSFERIGMIEFEGQSISHLAINDSSGLLAAVGDRVNLVTLEELDVQFSIAPDSKDGSFDQPVFLKDGASLLVARDNGGIEEMDSTTGQTVRKFKGHERRLQDVEIDRDRKLIVSCDTRGLVLIQNTEDPGEPLRIQVSGSVTEVLPIPDTELVGLGVFKHDHGELTCWIELRDVSTGELKYRETLGNDVVAEIEWHQDSLMVFLGNGKVCLIEGIRAR